MKRIVKAGSHEQWVLSETGWVTQYVENGAAVMVRMERKAA